MTKLWFIRAIRFKKGIGFVERVKFANIHELKVRFDETNDGCTMADGEVEVDDGETIGEALHEREQTRGETMDAREGKHIQFLTML